MAKHSFETGLAKKYGIAEALLLSYFDHWIKAAKLRKDTEKFHEGRYWTYASTRELARVFDYLSDPTLRRAVNHLVKENLLIKGSFNKFAWDKTTWYSLTDKYYQEVRGCAKMAQGVRQNDAGVRQNDATIPIQSTYSIPYKGNNKQTQSAKQVNEGQKVHHRYKNFLGTKYDPETYGKAMDAYSKYLGYPAEAGSAEIVCGMVDDYGLESVLYGFKIAYKNNVRNLNYVERCAQNYNPDAQQKSPPRRRHKNDVAAGVAEAQRILAEQEARAEASGGGAEEGEVDFAKLLGF